MLKLVSTKLNRLGATTGAAFTMGMLASAPAHATGSNTTGFNQIANNIVGGISNLPGLLTALAYMMGLLFAVLGVLKIKDHVENPSQTQLKDGAIRLAVGGALFTLPIVINSMQELIGDETQAGAKSLNAIKFQVN
jgi:hypothetical protein